ncbi:D-alanyl-D-alanine carboxypeptidase [Bacillus cereus]|nr:D-alanyl-D-alanine carboxypeptidase [Bacillus cereus]
MFEKTGHSKHKTGLTMDERKCALGRVHHSLFKGKYNWLCV